MLLNICATWCAPCRREMPMLERLQAELGGPDFEVVALSIDRKGLSVVKGPSPDHDAHQLSERAQALREQLLGALGPSLLLLLHLAEELTQFLIGEPRRLDQPSRPVSGVRLRPHLLRVAMERPRHGALRLIRASIDLAQRLLATLKLAF